jgi:hypothetical protein
MPNTPKALQLRQNTVLQMSGITRKTGIGRPQLNDWYALGHPAQQVVFSFHPLLINPLVNPLVNP